MQDRPTYEHDVQIGDLLTLRDADPLDPEHTWLRIIVTGIDEDNTPLAVVIDSNYSVWLQPKYRQPFRVNGLKFLAPNQVDIIRVDS